MPVSAGITCVIEVGFVERHGAWGNPSRGEVSERVARASARGSPRRPRRRKCRRRVRPGRIPRASLRGGVDSPRSMRRAGQSSGCVKRRRDERQEGNGCSDAARLSTETTFEGYECAAERFVGTVVLASTCQRNQRSEPHVWHRAAIGPRPSTGGNRRRGEKPQGRNVTSMEWHPLTRRAHSSERTRE